MQVVPIPWLELTIVTPLLGALLVWRVPDAEKSRRAALVVTFVTLLLALVTWGYFSVMQRAAIGRPGGEDARGFELGFGLLSRWAVIDELSAPLVPLAALLYFVTVMATLRTKVRRFPFTWTLVSESILLAMLACKEPWGLIGWLILQVVPPWWELRARGKPVRVFSLHMGLFCVLLIGGWAGVSATTAGTAPSMLAVGCLLGAVLLRSGSVPVHCWLTDLFEHATFGTALLFVAPMSGAYAAVRLLLPVAPDWALHGIAVVSLFTAVYASGMALVQREARRFFCYLFLSHASLVLVGLELTTVVGLTGALCVWLSVGISLTGFGLTLRALESRAGRQSLADFHGFYEHMPELAAFFLLTGLASIGFPGTVGFVGTELLVEGAVHVFPHVGMLVVATAALNSIAVFHAYFRLFTGSVHTATVSLHIRASERAAVSLLTILILGGGLVPQPGVDSRYHAAKAIMAERQLGPPLHHLPEIAVSAQPARDSHDIPRGL